MGIASHGAFAEEMLIEEKQAFQVLETLPVEHAAGFLMTPRPLICPGPPCGFETRETLLVHGGSGGVGTTAIQIGKPSVPVLPLQERRKLEICRQCGADEVVNYEKDDFIAAMKKWTGGRGADVIYDPVGGEILELSTKCIAWEGRLLRSGSQGNDSENCRQPHPAQEHFRDRTLLGKLHDAQSNPHP